MERNNYIRWPKTKSINQCEINRDIYGQKDKPLCLWKEIKPLDEWSKVQEMRRNEHHLIKGDKRS